MPLASCSLYAWQADGSSTQEQTNLCCLRVNTVVQIKRPCYVVACKLSLQSAWLAAVSLLYKPGELDLLGHRHSYLAQLTVQVKSFLLFKCDFELMIVFWWGARVFKCTVFFQNKNCKWMRISRYTLGERENALHKKKFQQCCNCNTTVLAYVSVLACVTEVWCTCCKGPWLWKIQKAQPWTARLLSLSLSYVSVSQNLSTVLGPCDCHSPYHCQCQCQCQCHCHCHCHSHSHCLGQGPCRCCFSKSQKIWMQDVADMHCYLLCFEV